MRLKDRTALITGAGGGIGQEIALAFAREGARVTIADITPDGAAATATLINERGGQALGVPMDVTLEQSVIQGVAAIFAVFGGIDILVSNAGFQIVRPIE